MKSFQRHLRTVFSQSNFIQNADKSTKVDRLDNLVSLLTYNYIHRSHTLGDAVRELATTSCQNTRSTIKTKLEILRNHPDSAILDLFGYGYAGIVLGSALYMWKCTPIEVEFNHDLPFDTADIPIRYTDRDGLTTTGFADNKSFRVKNTTKIFPLNSVVFPSYFVENTWYCKNGRIGRCDDPKQLEINTTVMSEALSSIYYKTKHEGGFSNKSIQEFETIVNLEADASNILYDINTYIQTGNFLDLRNRLNVGNIEGNMMTRYVNSLLESPYAILILAILSLVSLLLFIYICFTCFGCHKIMGKRHKVKKHEKMPKENYFLAVFNQNRVDTNLCQLEIDKVKACHNNIRDTLNEINAKLDSYTIVSKLEKSLLVPYNQDKR